MWSGVPNVSTTAKILMLESRRMPTGLCTGVGKSDSQMRWRRPWTPRPSARSSNAWRASPGCWRRTS